MTTGFARRIDMLLDVDDRAERARIIDLLKSDYTLQLESIADRTQQILLRYEEKAVTQYERVNIDLSNANTGISVAVDAMTEATARLVDVEVRLVEHVDTQFAAQHTAIETLTAATEVNGTRLKKLEHGQTTISASVEELRQRLIEDEAHYTIRLDRKRARIEALENELAAIREYLSPGQRVDIAAYVARLDAMERRLNEQGNG